MVGPVPCLFYWPTCKAAKFLFSEELEDALGYDFGNV